MLPVFAGAFGVNRGIIAVRFDKIRHVAYTVGTVAECRGNIKLNGARQRTVGEADSDILSRRGIGRGRPAGISYHAVNLHFVTATVQNPWKIYMKSGFFWPKIW